MRLHTIAAGAIGALVLQGCSNTETRAPGATTSSEHTTGGAGGGGGSGAGGGGDVCAITTEPPPAAKDLCARLSAGPAGAGPIPVDLSAAHAGVRFFASIGALADADQALVASLDAPAALTDPDLTAYAAALPGVVCALPAAGDAALPTAYVEMVGDVAVVHPGLGGIEVPLEAKAVALDLRGLVEAPGLRAALESNVAPLLIAPVEGVFRRVREHVGLEDEIFSATNVYGTNTHLRAEPAIASTGDRALPFAVLTEAKMAPSAALLAGTLRLAGQAFIFGEGVRTDVAEARWQGIGKRGLAYRAADLAWKPGSPTPARWPDELPADRRSLHPECLLAELPSLGIPLPFDSPPPLRAPMGAVHGFQEQQPSAIGLGVARAALISAHGAARLFFPYFATVGDHIDARLEATLGALGGAAPEDRAVMLHSLLRFGNALFDGHSFVGDNEATVAGYFPVLIEDVDGEPVIRRSAAPGVSPGDTITAIGGLPAATWYATELSRASAATDGYRFSVATSRYIRLSGPTKVALRHPNGAQESVDVVPQPKSVWMTIGLAASDRKAGFLTDLGAPNLYYINMDATALSSVGAAIDALTEAAPAKGLVLDMRGYPSIDTSLFTRHLMQASYTSPHYLITTLDGPDARSTYTAVIHDNPQGSPSFTGPIALLVGHRTVSAAEDFATRLVDQQRAKVVGRRSAGTNGNITGVELPGSFTFSFTGMEVRHADASESVFHGVGIVPDQESALTAAAFAAGVDPELMDAIAYLSTVGP